MDKRCALGMLLLLWCRTMITLSTVVNMATMDHDGLHGHYGHHSEHVVPWPEATLEATLSTVVNLATMDAMVGGHHGLHDQYGHHSEHMVTMVGGRRQGSPTLPPSM